MYGDQTYLPDSLKNNKAHNTLFMLPFIFGLIGMFYHFRKKGSDALVNFLLFFFTGFAIVIYLNQPGYQPRERDYAYVGSFYAFAVWIGLAVPYFIELASTWDQKIIEIHTYLRRCSRSFVFIGSICCRGRYRSGYWILLFCLVQWQQGSLCL